MKGKNSLDRRVKNFSRNGGKDQHLQVSLFLEVHILELTLTLAQSPER
ncbi:unnamed protein product [Arabidopsis thaliana]|uniref:(thale cress) hypothetical protein n=1 Tax=Arabidopsis thaliana TaxID=3702 RepID=A0A7G2FIQ0_ARATH|nr:unnamed protein product [Arabidopsis thaliana]